MRITNAIDAATVLAVLAAVALVAHRAAFVLSAEACWTVCG
tara:strand:+ start:665 stop:787 length:123 start_codon:yes stop_codon:yes gene_type:complete